MGEMKDVQVEGFEEDDHLDIKYLVHGKAVYFSSVAPAKMSTVRGAERIVRAICQQEEIAHKDYTFYDIQTHLGCPDIPAGKFRIKKLDIDHDIINITDWHDVTVLPPEAFGFAPLIGGDIPQLLSPVP